VTDLVILHYHFLPGGVSGVVRAAVRALRRHDAGIGRITLAAAAFPLQDFADWGAGLTAERIPELSYREGRELSRAAVAAEGRSLAESLLRRFGSENAVWWVHNHHLGRNPVFTQAVLEVARSGRQPLLLQIHDFPECGRYDSLARLRRCLAAPPYPLGLSVRYALINRRDLTALREAGVPESRLELLENPLETDGPPAEAAFGGPAGSPPGSRAGNPAATSADVKRALGLEDVGRPLLLCPVRCIRRKNVLEAALLCRLHPAPADLAVTLPGISAEERGYSARVRKAFRRGWAPGVFGAGPRLEAQGLGLADLFRAGDLVLSSSVQEGFGYPFLQSLAWGRPLLARELDVLEGMRDLFDGRPAEFYREVRAPLAPGPRQRLREGYRSKVERLAATGVLPAEVAWELGQRLESLCGEPAVEFSFLPAALQLELLCDAGRQPKLAAELRELNRGPLESMQRLLGEGRGMRGVGQPQPSQPGSGCPELAERIDSRFGLRRFAEAFARICRSFGSAGPLDSPPGAGSSAVPAVPAADEAAIWDRVIRRFATMENVRLLHGD
jgi:hypothetical protein